MKYLNKGAKARSEVSETLSMHMSNVAQLETLEILSIPIGNTIQINVSNVVHVGDIGDGVCGFYTNAYR